MASCTVASSHVVGTRESAARPVSVRPARRVFAAIHLFGRSAFCSAEHFCSGEALLVVVLAQRPAKGRAVPAYKTSGLVGRGKQTVASLKQRNSGPAPIC